MTAAADTTRMRRAALRALRGSWNDPKRISDDDVDKLREFSTPTLLHLLSMWPDERLLEIGNFGKKSLAALRELNSPEHRHVYRCNCGEEQ